MHLRTSLSGLFSEMIIELLAHDHPRYRLLGGDRDLALPAETQNHAGDLLLSERRQIIIENRLNFCRQATAAGFRARHVIFLQPEHFAAKLCEFIGCRAAARAQTYHDDIVLVCIRHVFPFLLFLPRMIDEMRCARGKRDI